MYPQGDKREAREKIDHLLEEAGWSIFDADKANLSAGRGVAIREFPLQGREAADYILYVDGKAAGVVEAKRIGATLTGVEIQSDKYTSGLPDSLPAEIFTEREWVPRTLFFAKDDAHAGNIVEIVREEFSKDNDFAKGYHRSQRIFNGRCRARQRKLG